jgi:hypothetical protein
MQRIVNLLALEKALCQWAMERGSRESVSITMDIDQ